MLALLEVFGGQARAEIPAAVPRKDRPMIRTALGITALTLTLLIAGCGGKSDQSSSTGSSSSSPAASGASTPESTGAPSGVSSTGGSGATNNAGSLPPGLDDGPRAAEAPADAAMAAHGEKLFQTPVAITRHGV